MGSRYVLAVDEVVEKKAGKKTWGVNWFYSSIAGKTIRSVSNHLISLVDTEKEYSFALTHQQTVKEVPIKSKLDFATFDYLIFHFGLWTKSLLTDLHFAIATFSSMIKALWIIKLNEVKTGKPF